MIRLAALEPSDLEVLYEAENDNTAWQDGSQTVPISYSTLMQYLTETKYDLQQDGQMRLAIKQDGMTVGFADLTGVDLINSKAEVGIYILKEYRNQGLGTEALKELEVYARKMHLHMIYAFVREQNKTARQLFHTAGYTEGALLKEWVRGDDGWVDCRIYSLILSRK